MMTYKRFCLGLVSVLLVLFVCNDCKVTIPSPIATGGSGPVDASPPSFLDASDSQSPPQACRAKLNRVYDRTRSDKDVTKPRIVGGVPSQPGVWPFAVALEQPSGWQYCGASLISASWVLTAAHCQVEVGDLAIIGRVDLRQTSVGERIAIAETRTHELYTSAENGSDVAVLRLAHPSTAKPVNLVPNGWFGPGQAATIIGWGLTSEGASSTSPVLREATDVPIWAPAVCSVAYAGLPTTVLCAGLSQGGKDTCQGDSGGPLLVKGLDGAWGQAGITSFGEGCARPGKPGVYTAVATVRDWIDTCAR